MIILFFLSLMPCQLINACVTESDIRNIRNKEYSWDFNLDYQPEEYHYIEKEKQVESYRQHEDLVVTICEYDKNKELYCYDLP